MGKKQHVDLYRKLLLRKQLIKFAASGAVYVPFCGDGDIAFELYRERVVFAADIDLKRTTRFSERLPSATVLCADCDTWPFGLVQQEFSVADFDAYAYPYDSFRAFWANAKKQFPLVMFFTDGERLAIKRAKRFHTPNGTRQDLVHTNRTRLFTQYPRMVIDYIRSAVHPCKLAMHRHYIRGSVIYVGVCIDV